jgi:mannose/cellobiose epimerase-like protein (N-acyl-D-glucosamine 2-epimerase family)
MRVPRPIADPLKQILEPDERRATRYALARALWASYGRAQAAKVKLSSDWRRGTRTTASPALDNPLDPERYRRHLAASLLPFWADHSIDTEFGGFLNCLDRQGRVFDTAKVSAMQARMIYAFARGHEVLGDSAYLDIARLGARFLTDHMWDRDAGGWFHKVTRNGETIRSQKRLFDQAYVLLALSVYARVSGDSAVLERAVEAYDLLDRHAWDREHGGYYERCDRDWSVSSSHKTLIVHIDMLDAVRALAAVTQRREHALRAEELTDLLMSRMRDRGTGCFVEHFYRDWRYHPLRTRDVIRIGQNFKAIQLLALAGGSAHAQDSTKTAAGREIMDFCLEHAWDHRHGGFFQFVARSGSIASAEKLWWTMCDGILALLTLYAAEGNARYREYAAALESFAFTHFVDPVFGEWYTSCRRDGSPLDTRKGSIGKAAYHTVQLCVDGLALLPVSGDRT